MPNPYPIFSFSFMQKYTLFVDRNGCSLRVCHLEFDVKAISYVFMTHSRVLRSCFVNSES